MYISVPKPVDQFETYSRDDNWISLRWKPPYPPTGTLDKYTIEYTQIRTWRNLKKSVNIEAEPCSFWNEYHCFKIENLDASYYYIINVRIVFFFNDNPLIMLFRYRFGLKIKNLMNYR